MKIGIVSLGDRGEESLRELLRLCPDAERYYTDRWRAYVSVLDPQKHILTKKRYININYSLHPFIIPLLRKRAYIGGKNTINHLSA